jgi:hypothetical protein
MFFYCGAVNNVELFRAIYAKILRSRVMDPDPARPEIICNLGSGSVNNFGSESKLSSVSNFQLINAKL